MDLSRETEEIIGKMDKMVLLEYNGISSFYELARNIAYNFTSRAKSGNAKNFSYSPKVLSKYGINTQLKLFIKSENLGRNEYGRFNVVEIGDDYAMVLYLNPNAIRNAAYSEFENNGGNFFQTFYKITLYTCVHELNHMQDNDYDGWYVPRATGKGENAMEYNYAKAIAYLFIGTEMNSRLSEACSYFYENPKVIDDLMNQSISNNSVSKKVVVEKMIEKAKPLTRMNDMQSCLYQVRDSNFGDEITSIYKKWCDKGNGRMAISIEGNDIKECRQQLIEGMENKINRFLGYQQVYFKRILEIFIKKYWR